MVLNLFKMALSPSEVIKLLRESSKGKLKYNRDESAAFNNYETDLRLIAIHPSCLQSTLSKRVTPSYNKPSRPSYQNHSFKDELGDENVELAFNPNDSLVVKTIDVARNKVSDLIREYEEQDRQMVQNVFEQKRNLYKAFCDTLYHNSLLALNARQLAKNKDDHLTSTKLAAKQQARQQEIEEKIGKLKNTYASRAKQTADRLEKASEKDELEAEESHKRALEIQQRINNFTASGRKLYIAYQEMANIIKSQENAKLLPDNIRQTVQSVNEIMNQFQKMMKQFHNRELEQEDVDLIQNLEKDTEMFLEAIKSSIASAKVQTKAPELYTDNGHETSVIPSSNIKSTVDVSGKTDAIHDTEIVKKWSYYVELKEKAMQLRDDIKSDQSLKTYRNDLQKVVNVLVNAISVQSGYFLFDKMLKLSQLLAGQHLTVMNNRKVSVQSHPKGKDFCLALMARKFVNQGEDVISANPTAAFPIASVIIGLWKNDPSFGEMFLANVYSKCPHLIPYRVPRLSEQSDDEYKITLGYEFVDGILEAEENYLKRMVGIAQLYAAVVASALPRGVSPPHPFPINHIWSWFARTLNREPISGITATILLTMLEVCGHLLMQTYGKQFQKLLILICREYFPKIQSVTAAGSQGPTARLEIFLQSFIKEGRLHPPQGILPPNFWTT